MVQFELQQEWQNCYKKINTYKLMQLKLQARQKCQTIFLTNNLRGYVAQTTRAADMLSKIPGQKRKYWCSSYCKISRKKLLRKNLCACVAQTRAWQNWDTKLLSNWISTDVTKTTGTQYRAQHLFEGAGFVQQEEKPLYSWGATLLAKIWKMFSSY